MPDGDESLGALVRRRLGDEILEQLVDPLLGGIYAGDPTKLGAESTFPAMVALERQHGSLLRAMKKGSGPPSRGARGGLHRAARGARR